MYRGLAGNREPYDRPVGYITLMSTKQRLSIQAARLFAERGYHGTSVSDLAAALGIHKSSVYAHIETKEDLLAEISLAGAAAFHAALDGLSSGTPSDRLRGALRAHLAVVKQQLDVATIWLLEWRFLTGEAREEFLRQRHAYERRILKLIEAAIAAGELRADLDPRCAMLLFFSVANWTYTWFDGDTDVDAVTDEYWELLVNGIGSRGDSRNGRAARRS
jgi:AcrR family transcriptional regulator